MHCRYEAVRRHDITRLEGFSDAVFGFALTLLVVSLDVPRSYAQLMDLMSGFLSFACCFALLLWLWHEHNIFFRRYGLQDGVTVAAQRLPALHGAALRLPAQVHVRFAVRAVDADAAIRPVQMALFELANASAIYAAGFIVMMLMFVLLYSRAHAKRHELGLSELEVFDLKALRGHHIVSVSVGFVSLAIALWAPLSWAPFSPDGARADGPRPWALGRPAQQAPARRSTRAARDSSRRASV